MKVTSDPGSAPPPSRSGESQTSEPKTFEKVLERKNEDRHGKKLRGQKRSGRETEAQDGLPGTAMPFVPLRQAATAGSRQGGARCPRSGRWMASFTRSL